jgi:hypothetical protein
MTKKPIAIIGSIDAKRTDYDPPLKNTPQARAAGCALGKALAEAAHPILVFSSSPDFIEAYIVEGYVQSRKAQAKSIIMLYPRKNTRPSTAISLSNRPTRNSSIPRPTHTLAGKFRITSRCQTSTVF